MPKYDFASDEELEEFEDLECKGAYGLTALRFRAVFNRLHELEEKSALMEKALVVLENAALYSRDQELFEPVYKAAHAGLGRCPADHSDWVKWLEDVYQALGPRTPSKVALADDIFKLLETKLRK